MRRQQMIAVILAVTFLAAGSLWAAGGKEQSTQPKAERVKLTMTFWGSPMEKKAIEDAVASYEKKMGNVDVETIHVPSSGTEFLVKLNAMIASGDAPDISYSSSWKNKMGQDGIIYNFYDLLAKDPIAKKDDWLQTCWWNWAPDRAPALSKRRHSVPDVQRRHVQRCRCRAPADQGFTGVELGQVRRGSAKDDPRYQRKKRPGPELRPEKYQAVRRHVRAQLVHVHAVRLLQRRRLPEADRKALGLAEPAATQAIQRIADLI